jgi:hypothetical protein
MFVFTSLTLMRLSGSPSQLIKEERSFASFLSLGKRKPKGRPFKPALKFLTPATPLG